MVAGSLHLMTCCSAKRIREKIADTSTVYSCKYLALLPLVAGCKVKQKPPIVCNT